MIVYDWYSENENSNKIDIVTKLDLFQTNLKLISELSFSILRTKLALITSGRIPSTTVTSGLLI